MILSSYLPSDKPPCDGGSEADQLECDADIPPSAAATRRRPPCRKLRDPLWQQHFLWESGITTSTNDAEVNFEPYSCLLARVMGLELSVKILDSLLCILIKPKDGTAHVWNTDTGDEVYR